MRVRGGLIGVSVLVASATACIAAGSSAEHTAMRTAGSSTVSAPADEARSSGAPTTFGPVGGSTPGRRPTGLPVGTSAQSLSVGGLTRHYRVHRPSAVSGSAALVVMLHGGSGSAAGAEKAYGWDAAADAHGFVVAYPDGTSAGWNVGGGCCGAPVRDGVDDVGFISALVRDVGAKTSIDPDRVYATGISEGGMMSYRLACDSRLFAAIGPDSATLLGSCPAPAPTSVIHIHGTADQRIRYDGRPGSGINHIDGPDVPALNAQWRAIDECPAPRVGSRATVTSSTASCPDGRGVTLITIAGAGHQWPGAPCNRRCDAGEADPPSDALSATEIIWSFFAAHTGRA